MMKHWLKLSESTLLPDDCIAQACPGLMLRAIHATAGASCAELPSSRLWMHLVELVQQTGDTFFALLEVSTGPFGARLRLSRLSTTS